MGKPRAKRAADKQKRRAARKARAPAPPRARAATTRAAADHFDADGMLWPEVFARVGYDAARVPAALDWLALDEPIRVERIRAYHRLAPAAKQPPNLEIHAAMHAIIETQLADGNPPNAREAMARLQGEGLGRHDAIHALASVLSRHMQAVAHGGAFDAEGYAADLGALTRARWLSTATG